MKNWLNNEETFGEFSAYMYFVGYDDTRGHSELPVNTVSTVNEILFFVIGKSFKAYTL